ncbi:MAG: Type secretion system pilin [Candidatus Parcubacteria bacterium]|jgi:hypothetical protein
MKKLLTTMSSAGASVGALFLPLVVHAQAFQEAQRGVDQVGSSAGINSTTELPVLIGNIINIVLGFLGIVLLGLILYAGFLWMTARGNGEQVEKATGIIRDSIIGLIIIVAAFAISRFVLGSLINVTA